MQNTTEPIILDNIKLQVDLPELMKKLRVKPESSYAPRLTQIARQAEIVARPKAVYRLVFIDRRGDDWVQVEEFQIHSRIMRINLEHARRLFAYLTTCGNELELWASSFSDMLEKYWLDTIMEMALDTATTAMLEHLEQTFNPGPTSAMHPGSLDDWPLSAQPVVFALLGEAVDKCGVQLTDTFMMYPIKSVSGFRFPSKISFESCQLCPRENCSSRKMPFDEVLFQTRYKMKINKTSEVSQTSEV